jgi:alpha-beta hydrolase superfamily lysophospholipase
VTFANGDIIVVIPGVMGSTLIRDGHEFWALTKRSIMRGLATLGHDLRHLKLAADIRDEPADDGVTAGRLMPDLHVLPGITPVSFGYETLLAHLRNRHGLVDGDDLLPFAYDWRLSNRHTGRRLGQVVTPLLEHRRVLYPDAKLIFLCHSMGGLVARWYLDQEGGAAHTRRLITIGTPHRGAATAIDRLVNGIAAKFGPIGATLTDLAQSMPSLYQLLPEYACIAVGDELHKTTEAGLPGLTTQPVADGMRFHDELDATVADGYQLHPIVGTDQPTTTTVRLTDGHAELLPTIGAEDRRGDATVPRIAAYPKRLADDDATIHYVCDTHGALPASRGVLDQIDGILTSSNRRYRAPELPIGVAADDVFLAGEPITVTAHTEDRRAAVEARLVDAETLRRDFGHARLAPTADETRHATLAGLPPGAYALRVGRRQPTGALTDMVTTPIVVLNP